MPRFSMGILPLLVLGCTAEEPITQNTQVDEISTEKISPQENASNILAQLESNISQDVPELIREQESKVNGIERDVLRPLEDAFLELNAKAFLKHLGPDVELPGFKGLEDLEDGDEDGGITEFTVSLDGKAKDLAGYLGGFSSSNYANLEIHEVTMMRGPVVCKVFFDFRGEANSLLRQDRGWMTITFEEIDGTWKIMNWDMAEQEILTAKETVFADVTEQAGLAKVPLFERLEALRRGGYAITVGDIDNDGDADIYIGGWGESHLYGNDGNGNFTDISKEAKIGLVDRVKAAAISDLDNDGDKDLVLSRFIDDKSEDVLIYLNEGEGTFTLKPDAIKKDLNYDRAMPLTVADFNKDAKLDIYVGFPGARDFTYIDNSPHQLNTHGLFMNTEDLQFVDATLVSGLDVEPSKRVGLAAYPHASVKADFDGDGTVDLLIADDRRGVSQVFKNDGSAKFQEVSAESGLDNTGWAMGAAVGDFNNDGLPDVYYSNIDFLAAKRISKALADSGETDITTFHGNKLYKNLGNGKFEDVTDTSGTGWAGEATAGSQWMDYDNDGDLDLVVLNGLWTGPGDQDVSSLFNQAYAAELLIEKHDNARAMAPVDSSTISLRNPGFNNMIIQSLMHFTGDLKDVKAKSNSDVPSLSFAGNQRHMVFRNNGDETFTEVGYLVGLDSIDDGYMPAIADVNGDGKVDLFVRNCDPGTKHYQYPSLRLFQNQMEGIGNGLQISLTGDGVNSNRDAVGAKITVKIGDQIMVREIDTVYGASQSEMKAFFGLGENDVADSVTINWPSGKVDTYENVGAGKISYIEK